MRTKDNSGNWLKRNLPDGENREFLENYKNRKAMAESWSPRDVVERIERIRPLQIKVILTLQYLFGSRISEILKLRKKDITFDLDGSLIARIQTEKRRDGHVKVIAINPNNNPELKPLFVEFFEYWSKRQIDKLDPEAYLFGDPEFVQVKRGDKYYLDNKLRMSVYYYAIKHAGLNPHLLRHARLSWLAHTKKKEFENVDRLLLVKTIADFTKFDSAEAYVRNMNLKQMKEVL